MHVSGRCPEDKPKLTDAERGNNVATAVWHWLLREKSLQYVPWVIDPGSATFDPYKKADQDARNSLLESLEAEIRRVSQSG